MSDNELIPCPNCVDCSLRGPCFVCTNGDDVQPKKITASMAVEISFFLKHGAVLSLEHALAIRKNHGLYSDRVDPALEIGEYPT